MSLFYVIVIVGSLVLTTVLSFVIGSVLSNKKMKRSLDDADDRAKLIIKEAEIAAENLKKDRILEAKEKILKMRSEFEEEANKKKNLIISNEQKIKQREQTLSKEIE
ncbi:MAG TPA: Rnase Y domain-containing protein, partial [Ohtaekwangia sp.]